MKVYEKLENLLKQPGAELDISKAMLFLASEIDRVEASIGNKVERIDPATMGYPVKQE